MDELVVPTRHISARLSTVAKVDSELSESLSACLESLRRCWLVIFIREKVGLPMVCRRSMPLL